VSFHSIVFAISVAILGAGLPIMLTAEGKVRMRSAVICAIATLGIVYGGWGLLKEDGLPAIGQPTTGAASGGGGTGGSNAGGGGGGKGAPRGNGGTYIGGNQYNYSVQPPLDEPSFPDKPEDVILSMGREYRYSSHR
jgi:hypothetical protein